MTDSMKLWINKPIKDSWKPIVIEFDYEDWRRLKRLSNRDNEWIFKFYNVILIKAGLPDLITLKNINVTPEVIDIVAGEEVYKRFYELGLQKYGERRWPWANLEFGLSEILREDDPSIKSSQILIRPTALGSHVWTKEVIDAIK